jgi:hypothetical protein
MEYLECIGSARTEHARRLGVRLRVRQRGKYGRDPDRNRNRPLRLHYPMAQQLVTGRFAVARNQRGAAKTAHRTLSHHSQRPRDEPSGERRNGRFEYEAKGVEIMTSDNRATLWNVAHQMGVAVISNVKDVKLIERAPQIPRVIEVSIQQAVRVEPDPLQTPCFIGDQRASEAPLEVRPHQDRRNLVGVFRSKTIEEFVSHQIHARPSLFGEIRQHCNAQPWITHLASWSDVRLPELDGSL